MATFKLGICKFTFVSEVFFGVILLSAVVLGTLPFFTALLYALGSFCAAGVVFRVFLPHARHGDTDTAQQTRRPRTSFTVVSGSRAA